MTIFGYVLTWDQEFHLYFVISVITALFALYLNHKFKYLLFIPLEKIVGKNYVKLSILSITLIVSMFVIFISIFQMTQTKHYERVWKVEQQ